MKRVLLFITVIYILGLICGLYVAWNPLYIIIIIALTVLSIVRFIRGRKIFCLIYLLFFAYGIFMSSHRIYRLESVTNPFLEQYVTVKGQITSSIESDKNVYTYDVYVTSIAADSRVSTQPCKIRVVDYKNSASYIKPFNNITISGKLDMRQQYRNEGSFNYNNYLLRKGISGVLAADYMPGITTYGSKKRLFMQIIYNVKMQAEKILDKFIKPDSSIIMKGILFGDISEIREDDYKKFQASGIVHVFAVSGYNMWLIFYLASKGLFFLKSHKWAKTFIIIIMLGIYTIMSGCTPSVMRSFIMIILVLLGKSVKRKSDPMTSLSIAALIILLFSPLMIGDTGFQLSFICVSSIVLILPKLKKLKIPVPDTVKNFIITTVSVQIGIFPIMIYYFNSMPIYVLLSNIIVIPLVTVFTLSGMAVIALSFISPDITYIAGRAAGFIGRVIMEAAGRISEAPYSQLSMVSPGIIEIAAYYFILIYLFKLINLREYMRKIAGWAIVVLMLFYIASGFMPLELKVSFIDVGQGDSILIMTPDRKCILIDGGGKSSGISTGVDIGEDVLKPFLFKQKINKIDMVISTHSHDDHLNGLVPVMKTFSVGTFVKSDIGEQEAYNTLLKENVIGNKNVINVSRGDIINAGRYVTMYVLNPSQNAVIEDENDCSIVLKLVYNDFSILFTGDISSDAEDELDKNMIEADIIKVPHHGSSGSLHEDFLDMVDPETAVICVGKNNFGHPSDITLQKIKERGIKLYRTDENGQITITTRGKGYWIRTSA